MTLKKLIDVLAMCMLLIFTASFLSGCDMKVGWDDETGGVTIERNVSVIVTDQDGNAIQGAHVETYNGNNEIIGREGFTGSTGRIILSIPEGQYYFKINHQTIVKEVDVSVTTFGVIPAVEVSYDMAEVTVRISPVIADVKINALEFDSETYIGKSSTTNSLGEAVFSLVEDLTKVQFEENYQGITSRSADTIDVRATSSYLFEIDVECMDVGDCSENCKVATACDGPSGCIFTAEASPFGDMSPCRVATCDSETGVWTEETQANTCFIDGICYDHGQVNPLNSCFRCDASIEGHQSVWSDNTDDGIVCTKDECENGEVKHSLDTANPACQCEDNAECPDTECIVGTCVDYACNYNNETNHGFGCDDGRFCTETARCNFGTCEMFIPKSCDDGIACTTNTCNEATDQCEFTPDGSCECETDIECEDGDPCTTHVCTNYVCVPGDHALKDGELCNDDQFCTATTKCSGGFCSDVVQLNGCSDSIECTVDSCDEATDSCLHDGESCQCETDIDCEDGDPCTTHVCTNYVCVPGDHALNDNTVCDDDDFCTTETRCSDGVCDNVITMMDCSDGIECTVDSCDEANDSCLHDTVNCDCNNDIECEDGDPCTTHVCTNYVCVPGDHALNNNTVCDDDDFCTTETRCSNGVCDNVVTMMDCSDGIECTVDSCDEATDSCLHDTVGCDCNNDTECEDGDPCTTNVCTNYVCVPGDHALNDNTVCIDDDFCTTETRCSNGVCDNVITMMDCSDGIECTVDSCNEALNSCENIANDSLCDDGAFCNGSEICDGTQCVDGTAPVTDDGVSCTDDSCDEVNDVVLNTANDSLCDDGAFCNGSEICDGTQCVSGTAPVTDDGVSCTDDSCDEVNDVVLNTANDSLCDDGAFCNGSEICDGTQCVSGTAPVTDDGVFCTDDTCDEVNDIVLNTANDSLCDDGAFCNGSEICDGTQCVDGTAPVTDDGVSCTDDTCDEVNDVVLNTANDSLCDDGAFCNGSEICDGTQCVDGTAPVTDDGVFCTDDSCDEVNDIVLNTANDSLCDDGIDCTNDFCSVEESGCLFETDDDNCTNSDGCPDNECIAIDNTYGGCSYDSSGMVCECEEDFDCEDPSPTTTNTCENYLCSDVAIDCTVPGDCDDGNPATGDTCNGSLKCENTGIACTLASECDDNNPCTDDTCDSLVCVNTPDEENSCDDGVYCNGDETCNWRGVCVAEERELDDEVYCTIDACDENTDTVTHTAQNTLCDDDKICTVDFCNVSSGCEFTTTIGCACTEDLDCSDFTYCNGEETCDGNNQCASGTSPAIVDDGITCTTQACDEDSNSIVTDYSACANSCEHDSEWYKNTQMVGDPDYCHYCDDGTVSVSANGTPCSEDFCEIDTCISGSCEGEDRNCHPTNEISSGFTYMDLCISDGGGSVVDVDSWKAHCENLYKCSSISENSNKFYCNCYAFVFRNWTIDQITDFDTVAYAGVTRTGDYVDGSDDQDSNVALFCSQAMNHLGF